MYRKLALFNAVLRSRRSILARKETIYSFLHQRSRACSTFAQDQEDKLEMDEAEIKPPRTFERRENAEMFRRQFNAQANNEIDKCEKVDVSLQLIRKALVKEDAHAKKLVLPAAKMLALIHAQGISIDENDNQLFIQQLRAKADQIPVESIRKTTNMLLNACEGKFDFALADGLIERLLCFHLLGALALRQGNLDALKQMCEGFGQAYHFYREEIFSIYPIMMEELQKEDSRVDSTRLLSIFLDQLAANKEMLVPGIEDFNTFISPAISLSKGWKLSPTDIDSSDHRCQLCKTEIPLKPKLNRTEFEALSAALKKTLTEYTGRDRFDMPLYYDRLCHLTERIRRKHDNGQHLKPLVIDGMNALHANFLKNGQDYATVNRNTELDIEGFESMMSSLSQQGYFPLLFVFKGNVPIFKGARAIDSIERLDGYYFSCGGSMDDLFVMNAAVMLGPNAQIFSNDAYSDHCSHKMPKRIQSLFKIWKESNFIRFSNKFAEYQVPSNYASAIQKDAGGYHIFVRPHYDANRWHNYPVQCLRKI